MKEKVNLRTWMLITIILSIAALRLLIPLLVGQPYNASPIGAMALFGGAYLGRNWKAFLVPLLALWISDWFLTLQHTGQFALFYPGFYWQYGSFVLVVLLGSVALRKKTVDRVVGGSLAASVLFFAISNFGVWAGSGLYPATSEGLLACYVAAIPFFWGTLAGDLFYSALLFGGFEWAGRRFPVLAAPPAEVA